MDDMRESIGFVKGVVYAFSAMFVAACSAGVLTATNLYEKIGALETSVALLDDRIAHANSATQAGASPPPRLRRDGLPGREGSR